MNAFDRGRRLVASSCRKDGVLDMLSVSGFLWFVNQVTLFVEELDETTGPWVQTIVHFAVSSATVFDFNIQARPKAPKISAQSSSHSTPAYSKAPSRAIGAMNRTISTQLGLGGTTKSSSSAIACGRVHCTAGRGMVIDN